MNEFEFDEFKDQGANLTGFSIVDYYNHNTIKLLGEIFHVKKPLSKIEVIPVLLV